jgi:hypothetical protein
MIACATTEAVVHGMGTRAFLSARGIFPLLEAEGFGQVLLVG